MSKAGVIRALITAEIHMREVLAGCRLLKNLPSGSDEEMFDCVVAGIVVCYTRSFLQNDGLSALPKEFSEFELPGLTKMHNALLEIRHKRYAHISQTYEPENFKVESPIKLLRKIELVIAENGHVTTQLMREGLGLEQIEVVIRLAEEQQRRFRAAFIQRCDQVVQEFNMQPGSYIVGESFPPTGTPIDYIISRFEFRLQVAARRFLEKWEIENGTPKTPEARKAQLKALIDRIT